MDPEDALVETLERLDEHTITEICKALGMDTDCSVGRRAEDLARHLCVTYGEEEAVRKVVDILKQHGLHHEAYRLSTSLMPFDAACDTKPRQKI